MAMMGMFTDGTSALRYALAGHAGLTLVSRKTGIRFTYKINGSDDGNVWFVRVLTGPNNEEDYTYLGTIFKNSLRYFHGKKSPISEGAASAKAFAWAWPFIASQQLPPSAEVWHDGRCGRCGRLLTVPESVASGIGPVCAEKEGW